MLIQDYVSTIPKTPYAHKGFEESISFNKKSFKLEDQSQEWQSQMRNFGQRMNEKGVCLIYFVHGTFAGDSPLGFVKLFDQKHSSFGALCKKFTKEYIVDIVLGDCGNYAKKYVELFEKAIDNKICCKRPIWSSEDNHVGRLIAAMELVKTIAKDIEHPKINRQKKGYYYKGTAMPVNCLHLFQTFYFHHRLRLANFAILLSIAREENILANLMSPYKQLNSIAWILSPSEHLLSINGQQQTIIDC